MQGLVVESHLWPRRWDIQGSPSPKRKGFLGDEEGFSGGKRGGDGGILCVGLFCPLHL